MLLTQANSETAHSGLKFTHSDEADDLPRGSPNV